MNDFDSRVHQTFGVIALQWTRFFGDASSRRVGGTRLVAPRASANNASDDALTSWESEGGSPCQASREPCKRGSAPGSEPSVLLGIVARRGQDPPFRPQR
jgi:hypothetical protein